MRIASRVIGVLLALAGVGFLAASILALISGFQRGSVLVDANPSKETWIAALFVACFGIGFVLGGWHYLRLDPDRIDDTEERPPWRFAPFFLAHRRELKVIAIIGLGISLVRLGATCFRVDWPGPWAGWALLLAGIVLAAIEGKIAKPNFGDRMERMRPAPRIIWKTIGAMYLILMLLLVWNQWGHHEMLSRIVRAGLIVLLFIWEAMFFDYGEAHARGSAQNALKT